MNRRIGQDGSVFQRGFAKQWNPKAPAYGRYWFDVPGRVERRRQVVTLGVCQSRTVARRKLRQHIEHEGINSRDYFNRNARTMTFGEQTERWLTHMATRRRNPVKPATLARWRYSLTKWLLPTLEDRPLAEVSNRVLREVIDKLTEAGQSPASVIGHVQAVKMVVWRERDGATPCYSRCLQEQACGLAKF